MPIGGQIQDELLRMSGGPNNPMETITATHRGPAAYFGGGRVIDFRLIIGGVVSGTNPTLDVSIQTSPDGNGSWVTAASFAQQTAQMGVAPYNQAEPPHVMVRTTDARPWLAALFTIGGTSTPTFTNVAVLTSFSADSVAP